MFVVVVIIVTMGLVAFAWLVLLGFVLFDGGGSMLVCVYHYIYFMMYSLGHVNCEIGVCFVWLCD